MLSDSSTPIGTLSMGLLNAPRRYAVYGGYLLCVYKKVLQFYCVGNPLIMWQKKKKKKQQKKKQQNKQSRFSDGFR